MLENNDIPQETDLNHVSVGRVGLVEDYWKKYIEANYFERKELVKSLPLIKSLIRNRKEIDKIDDELYEYMLLSYFQSYLDDALDVANVKIEEFYINRKVAR